MRVAWSTVGSKVGSVMVSGIDLFVTASSLGESHLSLLLVKAFQKVLFTPLCNPLSYIIELKVFRDSLY